jgi:predicted DNA-binding transcriptional regulator AlpA
MPTRYLRKIQVAERYGVTKRMVDKMVEEGRLPKPTYPTSDRIPLWNEQALDDNDRAAVTRHLKRKALEQQAEI